MKQMNSEDLFYNIVPTIYKTFVKRVDFMVNLLTQLKKNTPKIPKAGNEKCI